MYHMQYQPIPGCCYVSLAVAAGDKYTIFKTTADEWLNLEGDWAPYGFLCSPGQFLTSIKGHKWSVEADGVITKAISDLGPFTCSDRRALPNLAGANPVGASWASAGPSGYSEVTAVFNRVPLFFDFSFVGYMQLGPVGRSAFETGARDEGTGVEYQLRGPVGMVLAGVFGTSVDYISAQLVTNLGFIWRSAGMDQLANDLP